MKKLLLTVVLILQASVLMAWKPKPSFGLEWGYTGTILRTYQYNYIYSAGSRIIDNDAEWWYYSNGSVLAGAGLDLSGTVNLSVYSGLLGVYSHRWMIPVELRARWCPSGLEENGLITHAGLAATFPTATLRETSARLNLGAGRRFKVYKHISVDFLLSFNLTLDHDILSDPDTGAYIFPDKIVSNYSEYWGLNLSAAINF
ncbi:MAG: hypothetical protein J5737_05245 [Bacteroidales bacterium]|nr:hypothetical protein [Bacteroidales bacterium]